MAYPKKYGGNNRQYNNNDQRNNSNVESKHRSGAKWVTVEFKKILGSGTFKKIFAWKYTRKDGLISLQAYKNKDQVTKDGEALKLGYEKWYCKVKTRLGEQTVSAIFNTGKNILFFDLGTTKCVVNPNKDYFAYLMPEGMKNRKK